MFASGFFFTNLNIEKITGSDGFLLLTAIINSV